MPHVIVKLWPGRPEQKKAELAERIVKDVMEVFNLGEEYVSLSMEEISPDDWSEQCYKPDIINKRGKLYKEPGYSM